MTQKERTLRQDRVWGNDVSNWTCAVLNESVIVNGTSTAQPALRWTQVNCTGQTPLGSIGPMVINLVHADLSSPKLFFTPMTANTTHQLAPLNQIAAQDPRIVAGINGGYFYRTDTSSFIDNVCWGKNITDAEKPVSLKAPNDGVGDTLVIVDGELRSTNCDCIGYNRPALVVLNGTSTYITVQDLASPPPPGVVSGIAAGPNLVSLNTTTNETFVNIPRDDQNSNILEWSSNTGVGLIESSNEMVLVTVNGYDSCRLWDPVCGMDAYHLAFFMKDYVRVTTAMEMDQGGSTTMFVKGKGEQGIVSCSTDASCSYGPRPLFSALMIGAYDA